MAEDKMDTRELSWRQLFPWTELFRGFQIALDLNKLLLASAGILAMAFGWWLLAVVFSAGAKEPSWPGNYEANFPPETAPDQAWGAFKRDRTHWNLLHEATGAGGPSQRWTVEDLAESKTEYDLVRKVVPPSHERDRESSIKALTELKLPESRLQVYRKYLGVPKRAGTLATWPWFEDRGPNPYLLVTGQAGIPWEPGHFWEWFSRDQAPVMVEPLIKLFRPLVYFFSPRADSLFLRIYFFLVLLWTLATWSLFGGAITRIAAVQVARGDKIGMTEAFRFTMKRLVSYISAPLFPLAFIAVLIVFMCLFGVLHMIPFVGDIFVSGLFWPVMILFGVAIAIALVGLVGWPLMPATISAQGTDSWEAVSRSYSYVYQRPWQYIWYALVAVAYGGVVVFFVGFLGSFAVYLSKWGVAQTPGIQLANREPSFLFAYAPTSFGWRTLLLQGVKVNGQNVVEHGRINDDVYNRYVGRDPSYNGVDALSTVNRIGAVLVAFWLYLFFLLILGFGYSYFWSASTIIYLLLRKQVDAEEMDEVHLEEEEEGLYGGGPALAPAPAAPVPTRSSGTPLAMVEPPAFRPAPAAVPPEPGAVAEPAAAPATPASSTGDGNNPPAS